MYLWLWDWKKVGMVISVLIIIGVVVLMFNPFADKTILRPSDTTAYRKLNQPFVDLVATLRKSDDLCIIHVPLPPIPNTEIGWHWGNENVTSPGAGGYYAYMLLYNGTHVAIPPVVARAFKHDIYIVSECEVNGNSIVFKRFPTFVNRTSYGFNEQRAFGVPFGECASNYCEFGWRSWTRFSVPIREVYVFVNWYFNPVDGYKIRPPIGGLPYRVVVHTS